MLRHISQLPRVCSCLEQTSVSDVLVHMGGILHSVYVGRTCEVGAVLFAVLTQVPRAFLEWNDNASLLLHHSNVDSDVSLVIKRPETDANPLSVSCAKQCIP